MTAFEEREEALGRFAMVLAAFVPYYTTVDVEVTPHDLVILRASKVGDYGKGAERVRGASFVSIAGLHA